MFAVPQPPSGSTLDPNLVNVKLSSSSGAPLLLGNVCTDVDCTTHTNGWYFDDNSAPTQIHLCPDACALVDPSGSVDALLGCGTVAAASK